MNKRLPPHIQTWLNERGITDSVIERANVEWKGGEIALPVQDVDGKTLFYKYRRDPASSEGPKYRYEKGATSALYGVQFLVGEGPVVVCEGELDALVLISKGFLAVSTTGGSGTFEDEWKDHLLNREVFVCYDYDKPGWKGAFTVQDAIPWAKIIWLPSKVGEHGDVTDYFKLGNDAGAFKKLMSAARTYTVPKDWRMSETKKEFKEAEREYAHMMDVYMMEARHMRGAYESDAPVQCLLDMYRNAYEQVRRQIKYFQTTRDTTNPDRIAAAKTVPIPIFLKFNREKKGKCLWHEEKNPSMHFYEKQNRVWCFSCGQGGDVIDVVQKLNNCGLKEALQLILKDNPA